MNCLARIKVRLMIVASPYASQAMPDATVVSKTRLTTTDSITKQTRFPSLRLSSTSGHVLCVLRWHAVGLGSELGLGCADVRLAPS